MYVCVCEIYLVNVRLGVVVVVDAVAIDAVACCQVVEACAILGWQVIKCFVSKRGVFLL